MKGRKESLNSLIDPDKHKRPEPLAKRRQGRCVAGDTSVAERAPLPPVPTPFREIIVSHNSVPFDLWDNGDAGPIPPAGMAKPFVSFL